MIMNGKQIRILNEAVVPYVTVLTRHVPEGTSETMENKSSVAGNVAENRIG